MAALQTDLQGHLGTSCTPIIEPADTAELRVLLVRQVDERDVLERDLRQRATSMEITSVGSLLDAAAALEAESFDAMLVDLDLPDAPRSLVREILFAHPSDTPLIVLDRTGDEHYAVELVRQGAQDVLCTSVADTRTIMRSLSFAVARHDYALHVRDVRSRLDAIVQEVADRHRFEPLETLNGATAARTQLHDAASELRETLRRAATLLDDTESLVDDLASA